MESGVLQQAVLLIRSATNILLVSHKRPDGDTLGSSIAFHLALSSMGKRTTLACIDDMPQRFSFLPEIKKFVKDFNLSEYDLIIVNDAGAHHMTGFHEKYPDFLSKKIPIINIDHHESNDEFGTVNIVDTNAASATVLVWRLFKELGIVATKEIAIVLLAGIYNDTGCFMHANTNKETFEIASELAKTGVSTIEIVRPMFKESTFQQLKLWGHILENVQKNEKDVLFSVLTDSDLRAIQARGSDAGGIIDLMNTVPGAAFSMLLVEDEGLVKGSLRTQRDDVNVSDIAAQFGGGGHRKAAGFRMHGRLEKQIVWRIVPREKEAQ